MTTVDVHAHTIVPEVFELVTGQPGFRDGTADEAQFNRPRGLMIDGFNNVYVLDTGNNAIRRISTTNVVASSGPMPGMASVPRPARTPNVPPMTPPAVAPVAVPSGALVFFWWAKARVDSSSGMRAEMAWLLNPRVRRWSTPFSAVAGVA